jgi:hypothetical protein
MSETPVEVDADGKPSKAWLEAMYWGKQYSMGRIAKMVGTGYYQTPYRVLCKDQEERNRQREQANPLYPHSKRTEKCCPSVPQILRKMIVEALLLHRGDGKRHLPPIHPFWLVIAHSQVDQCSAFNQPEFSASGYPASPPTRWSGNWFLS